MHVMYISSGNLLYIKRLKISIYRRYLRIIFTNPKMLMIHKLALSLSLHVTDNSHKIKKKIYIKIIHRFFPNCMY